jgi:pyridoxine kinase
MKTVLCISSHTVAGVLGSPAASFILQTLGHRVWAVPTSLNSNHGGHPQALREPIAAKTLNGLIENLAANGWLRECDCILSGHFSSADQVAAVETWVKRLKVENPKALFCCDPVIGDDALEGFAPETGGIYVRDGVSEAVRDRLVPLADLVSPNRFELEYLSGHPCKGTEDAKAAALSLGVETVLATSIPVHAGLGQAGPGHGPAIHRSERRMATLCSTPKDVISLSTEDLRSVPKGTGDMFIALFLGHLLNGHDVAASLEAAVATSFDICRRSQSRPELALVQNQGLIRQLGQFQPK